MPERYGLFVMIVLGESIVAAVNGIGHLHHVEISFLLLLILSLAVSFAIWWLYYDFVARRSAKPQFAMQMLWNYLHLLLLIAIIAVGAAVHHLLAHGNVHGLQLIFGFWLFVVLFAIGSLEWVLVRSSNEPTHPLRSPLLKWGSGLACLALMALPIHFPGAVMLLCFIVLIGVNMVYGALSWYR